MNFNLKSICSTIKEHKYILIISLLFIIYLIIFLVKIIDIEEHKEDDTTNIINKCFSRNSESINKEYEQFIAIISLFKDNIKIISTVSRDSHCYKVVLNTNNNYNYYTFDIIMLYFMFTITGSILIQKYYNNTDNNISNKIKPLNDNELSIASLDEVDDEFISDIENNHI